MGKIANGIPCPGILTVASRPLIAADSMMVNGTAETAERAAKAGLRELAAPGISAPAGVTHDIAIAATPASKKLRTTSLPVHFANEVRSLSTR